jgi:hypothetical protein
MDVPRKIKSSDTQNQQLNKFKALAREAEADQDEAAFKKRLEKIAKPDTQKSK